MEVHPCCACSTRRVGSLSSGKFCLGNKNWRMPGRPTEQIVPEWQKIFTLAIAEMYKQDRSYCRIVAVLVAIHIGLTVVHDLIYPCSIYTWRNFFEFS
jgi:hypothetical protein